MKRSVFVLSVLLSLALLSACTQPPDPDAQTGPDTQQVSVTDASSEDAQQETSAQQQSASDPALQELTEQAAQQLLTRLGFALLSKFDTPSWLPLARMFYADASAVHAGHASEAASVQSDPAVQRVLAQIPAERSLEDALAGTTWFRRYTLAEISDEFTRLTGTDVTERQIFDLTDDARFCFVKSSDGVFYAAGYIQHTPAPVVTQVRRTDSGWQIDYLHTDGAGGASMEWADGQFLSGGTLTLDAQGRVCANRIDGDPKVQPGKCLPMSRSQTREILEQLRKMDAEALLSQPFSLPEEADLQALLCCGLIAPDEQAQALRAALGEPDWGAFAAAAPEQIAARLEQLTGAAPDARQIAALSWPYSETYGVYYGMISGVVLPIEDAKAYREPDGRILLAYAQTVEDASGKSFCGLAALEEDADGLRIVSNRRYPLQPPPPAQFSRGEETPEQGAVMDAVEAYLCEYDAIVCACEQRDLTACTLAALSDDELEAVPAVKSGQLSAGQIRKNAQFMELKADYLSRARQKQKLLRENSQYDYVYRSVELDGELAVADVSQFARFHYTGDPIESAQESMFTVRLANVGGVWRVAEVTELHWIDAQYYDLPADALARELDMLLEILEPG